MTVQPPPRNGVTPRTRVHRAVRARKVALGASIAGFVGLTGWLAVAPAVSNATASKSVVTSREDDGDDDGEHASSSTASSYGAAVPSSSSSSSAQTATVSRGS